MFLFGRYPIYLYIAILVKKNVNGHIKGGGRI